MRLDHVLKARLAASFREPFSLVFILLAIIISVLAAVTAQQKVEARLTVAIVSEDTGDLGEKLLATLLENKSFSMRETTREEAMRLLNQDRLEAAVIICGNYTEMLQKGEFKNVLELYTSPSSQVPATLSEPLVNATLMLWIEELSTLRTRDYLLEHGKTYSASDEASQREKVKVLWNSGSLVNVEKVELDGGEVPSQADSPFAACARWYGVLCLFYLVVGASWVLDINKKGLRIRISQAGVRQWKMIIASSLAPLIICAVGYLVAGVLCCIFVDASLLSIAEGFLPMFIYLIGLLGVTLLTASLMKNVLSLMFIAPILTFLNGVLSGLLLEMPAWAYVLKWISSALPGRWLNESLSAPLKSLPWALVCCTAWMCVGIAASALRSKRQKSL